MFIKNSNWSWQEVRILVKQELIGVPNVCIVIMGNNLETTRSQLADVLKMIVSVLAYGTVHRKFKFSVV